MAHVSIDLGGKEVFYDGDVVAGSVKVTFPQALEQVKCVKIELIGVSTAVLSEPFDASDIHAAHEGIQCGRGRLPALPEDHFIMSGKRSAHNLCYDSLVLLPTEEALTGVHPNHWNDFRTGFKEGDEVEAEFRFLLPPSSSCSCDSTGWYRMSTNWGRSFHEKVFGPPNVASGCCLPSPRETPKCCCQTRLPPSFYAIVNNRAAAAVEYYLLLTVRGDFGELIEKKFPLTVKTRQRDVHVPLRHPERPGVPKGVWTSKPWPESQLVFPERPPRPTPAPANEPSLLERLVGQAAASFGTSLPPPPPAPWRFGPTVRDFSLKPLSLVVEPAEEGLPYDTDLKHRITHVLFESPHPAQYYLSQFDDDEGKSSVHKYTQSTLKAGSWLTFTDRYKINDTTYYTTEKKGRVERDVVLDLANIEPMANIVGRLSDRARYATGLSGQSLDQRWGLLLPLGCLPFELSPDWQFEIQTANFHHSSRPEVSLCLVFVNDYPGTWNQLMFDLSFDHYSGEESRK